MISGSQLSSNPYNEYQPGNNRVYTRASDNYESGTSAYGQFFENLARSSTKLST